MKKTLLTLILLFVFNLSYSQAIFSSVEQAKYSHGEPLQFVSKSNYLIEVSFHTKEGFILVKNKDLNSTTKYINVVPGKKPNSWRGYSKELNKVCIFSILTNSSGVCITIDDNLFVYFLMIDEAKKTNKIK